MTVDYPLREPRRVRYGPLAADLCNLAIEVDGQRAELQPLQRRMLFYMLSNLHRPISRREFLDQIWESHHEATSSSVRRQIHGLRRALGSAGALIETVGRAGWGIGVREPDGCGADRR